MADSFLEKVDLYSNNSKRIMTRIDIITQFFSMRISNGQVDKSFLWFEFTHL